VVLRSLGGNTHQVTRKLTLLPLNKASTDCITFIRMFTFTLYFLQMIVHLSIGVLWKLRCIRVTLTLYLVYPHNGVDDRMAMLSK
jgi:hypothetical protein